jgi:hypothetical protein
MTRRELCHATKRGGDFAQETDVHLCCAGLINLQRLRILWKFLWGLGDGSKNKPLTLSSIETMLIEETHSDWDGPLSP